MNIVKSEYIYLLPGRGARADGLVGSLLSQQGYSFEAREVAGEFLSLPFSKQLEIIQVDLREFWHSKVRLIAQSYGGYLLLHALYQFEEIFPGKILLFSPVLGASRASASRVIVSPPRAKRLLEYARGGKLAEFDIEAHTGELDNGCDPELAKEIFSHIPKSKLNVIDGATHSLSAEYVYKALERFLSENSCK